MTPQHPEAFDLPVPRVVQGSPPTSEFRPWGRLCIDPSALIYGAPNQNRLRRPQACLKIYPNASLASSTG